METEIYKGYEIEIDNTDYAENPFEQWDGNVPLISKHGDGGTDYSKGNINSYLETFFTDNQIVRHQKKIAEIFNIDLQYFKDYEFSKDDKISDIRSAIYESNDFKELEEFCQLAKIPHLRTSRNGYSQGDWSELFICETPQFLEETGCTSLTDEMMKAGADLYGFWAFGDVYSFNIPAIEDACSGFYGTDHEKSGLMEEAKSSIDSHIKYVTKNKFKKIKELIKAKVSLIYRRAILEEFNQQLC